MENVKISVLVAVYNAKPYLHQCLDSLLHQSLMEIQVICVDDASTDGSWGILRQYQRQDSRIEVLRQERNMGQAKARNLALQRAKGCYTCFLDSDDFLSEDALERVVECFERNSEVDAVLFRCRYYYEDGSSIGYRMQPFDSISGKEAFERSLDWQIHGVYAIRTYIHRRIPYDDSLHAYSDDNTTRLHFLACRKVATSLGVYYYRQHDQSVTHQVSPRRFDYLLANERMRYILQEQQVERRLVDCYENHRWLNLIGLTLFAYSHRSSLSLADWTYAMEIIKREWWSMDCRALYARNHYKLGYLAFRTRFIPRHVGWKLFLWQEWLYYLVRKLRGSLPE